MVDMSFETVAAVDLGSNSFHMIIARVTEGGLQTIDRMREMVRLGGGLDEQGNLNSAARIRAINCLERFGQRLRGMPLGSVRAVGTNTLRRTRDVNSFLRQAHEALGHPIEVIAGREEARLIYLGVAHSLPPSMGKRLVIDIGGGSTEFILGEGFAAHHCESLVMGCVSYSSRFFPNGVLNAHTLHSAEIAAAQEIQIIQPHYRAIGWENAVGSSGTIRAIHDILQAYHWTDDGITLSGLQELRRAFLAAGNIHLLNLNGLSPERAPVLPGGFAILNAVFVHLGVKRLTVSEGALREGLIYDLLGRLTHEDVRERTIRGLMRRYHVDFNQARRVERTALFLLSQIKTDYSPTLPLSEHRLMLSWAALLHEIGLNIAHSDYHLHGAYVAANSDLPGFSRAAQQFLSFLLRTQRRHLTPELFSTLPEGYSEVAWRLCVILRLAILLHRSRSSVILPGLGIQFKERKRSVRIFFPEFWLDCHPLTRADLAEEVKYLKYAGIRFRFN